MLHHRRDRKFMTQLRPESDPSRHCDLQYFMSVFSTALKLPVN
jgi:hypothetical protein